MAENETIHIRGLDQLLKALKEKAPQIRVGILGDKNARKEGKGSSNAEIGAAHEYGTSTLPQRSFLRVPIQENLDKEMEKSNLFTPDTFAEVIKGGTVIPWAEKVGICAEACVADAFATGGNGKWAAWKTPGYENNTGDILVDTKQLRDSITSDVKK